MSSAKPWNSLAPRSLFELGENRPFTSQHSSVGELSRTPIVEAYRLSRAGWYIGDSIEPSNGGLVFCEKSYKASATFNALPNWSNPSWSRSGGEWNKLVYFRAIKSLRVCHIGSL